MTAAEVNHPLFARFFDRLSRLVEREISAERDQLLAGLSGRILEIGPGNGVNFSHYPATVDEVIALEPEAFLRGKARATAIHAPVRIEVRDAVASPLPFEDNSFDGAVSSLVLCSVPDPPATAAELRRVLKPGGQLRFIEHIRSDHPTRRAIQQTVDRSGVWPRLFGGCHCSRPTPQTLEAAGFELEQVRQLHLGPPWMITQPHVIGIARAGHG